MPAWASLPAKQRWQIVTYVESLGTSQGKASAPEAIAPPPSDLNTSKLKAPPPTPPFTDFRYEKPGTLHKITVNDLPQPYATKSRFNSPDMVARPENAWPSAPAGFKVELYAAGLDNPRTLRTAPNGDIFLAESDPGRIRVFRGLTTGGKPEQCGDLCQRAETAVWSGFLSSRSRSAMVICGQHRRSRSFPLSQGRFEGERTAATHRRPAAWGLVRAQDAGGRIFAGWQDECLSRWARHRTWTIPTPPGEKDRADILACDPANCVLRVYAYGIRNAGGGIAVNPQTGELWCSVNERDALGDNLVPDYITHVQEGGFYGWPWWYIGAHQDPRHQGKHPELKDKVIVPDVLLQPHNASLEFTFYNGQQFPAEYKGDIFASEHGSWNKAVRVGYEVIRVPLHQTGHASGEYEDFLTGFRAAGWQRVGTPGGRDGGSGWIAAGKRRRIELGVES